jgi:hypothetical protein
MTALQSRTDSKPRRVRLCVNDHKLFAPAERRCELGAQMESTKDASFAQRVAGGPA